MKVFAVPTTNIFIMEALFSTYDEASYEARVASTDAEREAIFSIRMKVFVDEQKVPPEEELDSYDLTALHFLISVKRLISDHAYEEEPLIAGTARLIDKGEGTGKIGRVAVLKEFRGRGLGARLMRFIEAEATLRGFERLILEAQVSAISFYEKLGYVAEGEVFLDANIEHRLMKKEKLRRG